jgi:hypothetical protein
MTGQVNGAGVSFFLGGLAGVKGRTGRLFIKLTETGESSGEISNEMNGRFPLGSVFIFYYSIASKHLVPSSS